MKQIILIVTLLLSSHLLMAAPDVETEKAESQKFLDKEAKVAKTEKTLSGLLYRPIKVGKGAYPKETDTVTVDYKGTLRTGQVFDESPKGEPISFPLNRVVPCWTEALKKMQVGGSAVIVCPSDIAYGDEGRGPTIKGGAALKFEVTLHKIAPF
jgi:FKBP-type peptidyl-prolyl cis-trans isomerase FkpA